MIFVGDIFVRNRTKRDVHTEVIVANELLLELLLAVVDLEEIRRRVNGLILVFHYYYYLYTANRKDHLYRRDVVDIMITVTLYIASSQQKFRTLP